MKKKHIIISFCFLVLLSIFTFFDLEFSKLIVNDKSIFGYIYEVIGELPVYIGVLLFGITLFNMAKKDFYKILSVLITLVGSVMVLIMPARYLVSFNGIIVTALALASIALSCLLLHFSKKVDEEFYRKLAPISCVYFIVCCMGPAIVFVIKTFVGRVRFQDLSDSYTEFTRWYIVNGITGHHSFPSGHTCSAATILALNNIPKSFELSKKQRIVLYTITISHIVLTGISRIILGRHYVSDVLVGFMIVYVIKEIFTAMFYKHRQED